LIFLEKGKSLWIFWINELPNSLWLHSPSFCCYIYDILGLKSVV
jgi:hypothetical protein